MLVRRKEGSLGEVGRPEPAAGRGAQCLLNSGTKSRCTRPAKPTLTQHSGASFPGLPSSTLGQAPAGRGSLVRAQPVHWASAPLALLQLTSETNAQLQGQPQPQLGTQNLSAEKELGSSLARS